MMKAYLAEVDSLRLEIEKQAQEIADAADGASEESTSARRPDSEYKGGGEAAMTSPAKLRPRPQRQPQDGA